MHDKAIEIRSRDYWFKIVEFLQQNLALIDEGHHGAACTVLFFGDTGGVCDRLRLASVAEAEEVRIPAKVVLRNNPITPTRAPTDIRDASHPAPI